MFVLFFVGVLYVSCIVFILFNDFGIFFIRKWKDINLKMFSLFIVWIFCICKYVYINLSGIEVRNVCLVMIMYNYIC